MTEETLDQISDADVFKEAVSDAPKAEAEEKKEAEAEDRARDEKGRFVAKDKSEDAVDETPPATEAAVEEAPLETPKKEKHENRIPLTELLNEREKRQNAERERAAYEQQLWQLQQQVQQLQQKPQEPIDIFADPQAYTQSIETTMADRLRALEANFSLRLANYKYGDTFTEAFQAVMQRPLSDPMRQQVINSSDPGETLVQMYQREQTFKEVGNDPAAYKSKVLEDALKDPQFLAKALQAARQTAGAQPTNNKIDLPPSLNKVASAHIGDENSDNSDSSIFAYATRR